MAEQASVLLRLWRSRLIRDTSALQVVAGIRALLLFAGGIVLARMLKPVEYGQYALILAMASLPAVVFDLGARKGVLTGLARSRVARDEGRAAEMIVFGLSASLLSACLVLVVGLPSLPLLAHVAFGDRRLGVLAWCLAWTSVIHVPYELVTVVLESSRKMALVARLEVAAETLRLVAIGLAFMLGAGLTGVVAALLAASVLQSLAALWIVRSRRRRSEIGIPMLPHLSFTMAGDLFKRNLSFSLRASLGKRLEGSVRAMLAMLLGFVASEREVAFLRAGAAFAGIPFWFIAALGRSSFAKLAEIEGQQGKADYARSLLALSLGAVGVVSLLAAVTAWILPTLITYSYGAEFLPAAGVANVLLIGVVLSAFSVGHEAFYLLRGSLRALNLRALLAAVVVLGSAPWLVSASGARGAALAIVLGTGAACAIDFAAARRFLRSPRAADSVEAR